MKEKGVPPRIEFQLKHQIQKDRVSEMKKWARFLKRAREEHREINLAIVAANNHYAGFGPGTANSFRKMLDLSEVTWDIDYDNNLNPENDGDGSEGYDGSRDSAHDINETSALVVTATNQEEISSNTVEKGQGTVPGAVTAVTAPESENNKYNTIDMQISLHPKITLQQPQPIDPKIKNNAGDIYRSGANWYCRHCKLSGDKFYMQVHICKGYIPI